MFQAPVVASQQVFAVAIESHTLQKHPLVFNIAIPYCNL